MGKWIQKATAGAHGKFRAKARKRHMSTREFAAAVSAHPGRYDTRTRRQAALAKTLMKTHGGSK